MNAGAFENKHLKLRISLNLNASGTYSSWVVVCHLYKITIIIKSTWNNQLQPIVTKTEVQLLMFVFRDRANTCSMCWKLWLSINRWGGLELMGFGLCKFHIWVSKPSVLMLHSAACLDFRVVTKRLVNDTIDVHSTWKNAFMLHYVFSSR